MTRDKLFAIAVECGIKENREQALQLIREKLIEYFNSPEGKQALARAPRVIVEGNNNFPLQDTAIEVLVDLLMQEVEDFDFR